MKCFRVGPSVREFWLGLLALAARTAAVAAHNQVQRANVREVRDGVVLWLHLDGLFRAITAMTTASGEAVLPRRARAAHCEGQHRRLRARPVGHNDAQRPGHARADAFASAHAAAHERALRHLTDTADLVVGSVASREIEMQRGKAVAPPRWPWHLALWPRHTDCMVVAAKQRSPSRNAAILPGITPTICRCVTRG